MKTTVSTLKRNSIIVVLFFLSISVLKAQEYSQALSSMNVTEAQKIQSLVEELQPSLYVKQASIEQFGDQSSRVVFCEISSLERLYELNQEYQTVEIIRISVSNPSELSYSMDFKNLESFASLKYIYIVFQYDVCGGLSQSCIAGYANAMIQNISPKVKLLYKLDIVE